MANGTVFVENILLVPVNQETQGQQSLAVPGGGGNLLFFVAIIRA